MASDDKMLEDAGVDRVGFDRVRWERLKAEIVTEVMAQLRADMFNASMKLNALWNRPMTSSEVILTEGPSDEDAMRSRLAMLDQMGMERNQLAQAVLQIRNILAADMDPMAALQKIERVLEVLP